MKAWFEAKGKGPVDLQPGKSGQFDIAVDGTLVYSRYDTGRFPWEADLEKARERVGRLGCPTAMKMPGFANVVVTVALSLACTAVHAQEKAPTETVLPSVTATATRDPVEKSYRKIIKGMDLFEERKRILAPNATLRFKLLPRQPGTDMNGITVEIVGDTVALPIFVARDRTFTLERNQKALDENAAVMPNRKASSMTWRTEIRTPGLPPNTRRLGDLRLECLVGNEAGLVSNSLAIFGQIASMFVGANEYCGRVDSQYLYFSERPLFGVTLVAGSRREALSIDKLYAGASYDTNLKADLPYCDCQVLIDRTYFLPLGDRSWPDDTLVEYEYMDDNDGRVTENAPSSG